MYGRQDNMEGIGDEKLTFQRFEEKEM